MLTNFAAAWKILVRFPLPIKDDGEELDPARILCWLPVVGLVLGLGLWLLAELTFFIVGADIAARIVAAILVPAAFWWVVRARSLGAVMAVAAGWRAPGAGESEFAGMIHPHLPMFAVQAIVLLKIIGLGILFSRGMGPWLIVMGLLSATVYVELSQGRGAEGKGSFQHWYVPVIVTLIVAGLVDQLVAGLFCLVLAWLVAPVLLNLLASRTAADASQKQWSVIELAEGLIIWIGVLAL